uniref:Uncharacterized protein n=1 Tax=Romanomermis culicivorax TaxID=13658 RepID=A0A915JUE3_ROMCU
MHKVSCLLRTKKIEKRTKLFRFRIDIRQNGYETGYCPSVNGATTAAAIVYWPSSSRYWSCGEERFRGSGFPCRSGSRMER